MWCGVLLAETQETAPGERSGARKGPTSTAVATTTTSRRGKPQSAIDVKQQQQDKSKAKELVPPQAGTTQGTSDPSEALKCLHEVLIKWRSRIVLQAQHSHRGKCRVNRSQSPPCTPRARPMRVRARGSAIGSASPTRRRIPR